MYSDEIIFQYIIGLGCHKSRTYQITPDYNVPFQFQCSHTVSNKLLSKLVGKQYRYFKPYYKDMQNFCLYTKSENQKYIVQFGDYKMQSYGMSKSRLISERCNIIIPLNMARHWNFKIIKSEFPWRLKREAIIWRGTTTGEDTRREYVQSLYKQHNVRFTRIVQHKKHWITNTRQLGQPMSKEAILRYKYVLSLPGNDVATNLKWLMFQNSVIVMPPPKVEGWLLEGLLQPFVHYVPIYHPDNITNVLNWMKENDDKCKQIVSNANKYIKRLYNYNENMLQRVFKYAANKTWNHTVTQNIVSSKDYYT